MSKRLQAIAAQVADHRLLRLIFLSTLVLLPIALIGLITGNGWLAVIALGLSAVADGLLRWSRLSGGRMLAELRDRSSQFTTLRAGMATIALLTMADMPIAAAVLAVGLVGSALARVIAGWLYAYARRVTERGEQGIVTGEVDTPSAPGAGLGIRYARWLTASELVSVGVLGAALGGVGQGPSTIFVAIAWAFPALWLVGSAVHSTFQRRSYTLDVEVTGRVAVYFAEPKSRAYQLRQWLPVLDELHESVGVLLIFRDRKCFDHFGELTSLPRLFARTFDDLTDVYEAGDHGVILYVNNGMRNFQSLAWPHAMHAHINHGESDKTSLVTHQSRAYDRVLVAGEAAVARMKAGLLEVDMSAIAIVGRPQLDYVDVTSERSLNDRPVLVYAPTWEGERDANNFSSVDVGGVEIVRALLAVPDAIVVYKPHPRTPASAKPEMRRAHQEICDLLAAAAAADPTRGHGQWEDDILPLLARADLLVADVSSVTVDHLYLRPDARLVLMDRGSGGGRVIASEIPVSRSAEVVRADDVGGLTETAARLLASDEQAETRREVRREYFGDFAVGESTRRFGEIVFELVERRDRAVGAQPSLNAQQETGTQPALPLRAYS